MNDRPKKPAGKSRFAGGHQKSWLWGRRAVLETVRSGRWPIREVLLTDEAIRSQAELMAALADHNLPHSQVEPRRIEQLCRSDQHQGVLVRLGEFEYGNVEQLPSLIADRQPDDLAIIVVCDRIQDAFNFGAILRCCDGSGVDAVVVGESGQAAVTPHVVRASAGAVNHLTIMRTDELSAAVRTMKQLGVLVVAASEKADCSVWEAELGGSVALIVGSEGSGIQRELLELCDRVVGIPMHGEVSSLNVAVATGIPLYEIRRQIEVVGSRR